MRAKLTFLALLFTSLFVSPLRAADEPAKVKIEATDPRATTVVALFNAGLANDLNAFKACFSKEAAGKIKEEEFPKAIEGFARKYKRLFGETKPQDLQYSYEGDEKEGKIYLSTKGPEAKTSPKLKVIKEGDAWKVNER